MRTEITRFDYRVKRGGGIAEFLGFDDLPKGATLASPAEVPLKPRAFQEGRPVAWCCPYLASTELLMVSEPRD